MDYRECEKVMEIVSQLNAEGTTVIMVCQDMEVVGDFAKRVIAMIRGRGGVAARPQIRGARAIGYRFG